MSVFYLEIKDVHFLLLTTNKTEYIWEIKISIFFLKWMKIFYRLVGKEFRKSISFLSLLLVLFSIVERGEFRRRNKPTLRRRKVTKKRNITESYTQFSLRLLPYTLFWHTCFLYYSLYYSLTTLSTFFTTLNPCFVETNLFYLCFIL